jgi:LysM repeat protein
MGSPKQEVTDMTDYGGDFSDWNAINNAVALRATGIVFGWCKATEGTGFVATTYAGKMNQLAAAGLVTAPYHFADGASPVAEARHFKAVAGGQLGSGHLLWMLDMEAAGVRAGADAFVVGFAREMASPGVVYGNLDWWTNVLHPANWGGLALSGCIARYNGNPGQPGFTNPSMGFNQFTSTLQRAGVAGNMDGDCTMPGHSLSQYIVGGGVPAPIQPSPPAPTPTGLPDTYTVQPGDTLSAIASEWGVTVSAAAAANGIPDPNKIFVGQVLHKPGTGQAAPLPAPSGATYTVRSGDTLSAIAAAERTTVAVLVALNHISNPDRIYPGQVLTLPTAGPVVPVATDHVWTVQRGQSLSSIAAATHYPGGWPALAAFNHIANPNLIYPGQILHY